MGYPFHMTPSHCCSSNAGQKSSQYVIPIVTFVYVHDLHIVDIIYTHTVRVNTT